MDAHLCATTLFGPREARVWWHRTFSVIGLPAPAVRVRNDGPSPVRHRRHGCYAELQSRIDTCAGRTDRAEARTSQRDARCRCEVGKHGAVRSRDACGECEMAGGRETCDLASLRCPAWRIRSPSDYARWRDGQRQWESTDRESRTARRWRLRARVDMRRLPGDARASASSR